MGDMDDVIALTAKDVILDTHQLRQLSRFCLRAHSSVDMMGASIIERELRKGYPVFPVLDELIKATAAKALEKLGLNSLPPTKAFYIKFATVESDYLTRRIVAHVTKAAQGRAGENFYLDLLHHSSDGDLSNMIHVLFDLYASIDQGRARVAMA